MSLAASAWAAYCVAAGVAKSGEKSWDKVAEIHADSFFREVETEAQETPFDLGPRWQGLGGLKAWCFPNPLDHRPLHRPLHQTRWKVKRKASQ